MIIPLIMATGDDAAGGRANRGRGGIRSQEEEGEEEERAREEGEEACRQLLLEKRLERLE